MNINTNSTEKNENKMQEKEQKIVNESCVSHLREMLIVDDLEVNRQVLAECFEGEYEFIYACDGTETMEKIETHADSLSIILLDIVMPKMNGIEVLKWLSKTHYNFIPVVAITAEPEYQLEALKNGAWDFIAKPADNTVIKARVNNVLGRYSAASQQNTIHMLQKARLEIDNLVNSIPGGIAIYKLTDHFERIYLSDGIAVLTGHTPEEYQIYMNQPAENMVYDGDRERLISSAVEALKMGQDISINYRLCHKNGSLIWVCLNATVISENNGEPIIHAVIQSVSKQDRLYDLLVNETPSAVYVTNADTYEMLYLNETAVCILHTQGKNYGGKKCYEYIFKRTSPCPFCKMNEMTKDFFSERVFEHPLNHRTYHLKGKLVDWCGINTHVEYILDVTEQYTAQAQLKEAQNMLAAALYNTNVTVWEYDIENKCIIQSLNSMETHGFETIVPNVPEALIENGFVHPQSANDYRELYQEVLAGKPKAQRDVLVQKANRKGYWWERITYIPVFSNNGQHLKSIGTSIDVTEQKNMEESFQEIESLRGKITNGIMINISKDTVESVYSNIDGIDELNDGNMTHFFQKSGLRIPDKKQRETFYEVFNQENLLHAYAMGRTEQFVEALFLYQGEEYRILQLHIRTIKNPYTGDVIGYTYIVDVNEQRMSEAIIDKVSLENFEFILLLNVAKNTAKMISNISDETLSAPREYPDYKNGINAFCDHFLVEDEHERCKAQMSIENIVKQLETQSKYTITVSAYGRNKEKRIKRLSYSYLNKTTKEVLVTAEDITELMQEEQEKSSRLLKALEMAEKASESKSDFLSNMSHDMRTPMNAIIGFSRMALDENTSGEVMSEYMKKINESGYYLLNLINDVLDMAKIENKKMDLKLQPVDAKELFGGIVSSIKPMMDAKHIDFVFENRNFVEGKAAIVDKLRMQQIFVNLLSNAVKFTPVHGKIECIIEQLHFDGKYAKDRVVIRDNGSGMSEEFLRKAFLPFEQEHTNRAESNDGTGLGLPIVKSLVDLMGGTIELNSTKGIGTEVILHFTTELVDEDILNDTLDGSPNTDFAGKTILLCEDHPLNREIAGKLLLKKGFKIECAVNGAEGLSMFEESPEQYYDAILMDIRMPVMDGLQVAEAIRQLSRADAKTVPIIAMTANAFDDDIKKSIDAGMNAHLAKPIEPAKLYATLQEMINKENE